MLTKRTALGLISASMGIGVALGLWGWSLQPEQPARWLVPVLVPAALWAYVEWVARSGHRRHARHADLLPWHRVVFGTYVLFVAAKFGLRLAFGYEVLAPDWMPAARRSVGVASGMLLVLWGNYLPKLLSPWTPETQPFDWQGVHRFVGRVAALGGLTLILVWVALPLGDAIRSSPIVVLVTLGIVLLRKLYSVATYPGRRDRPVPSR